MERAVGEIKHLTRPIVDLMYIARPIDGQRVIVELTTTAFRLRDDADLEAVQTEAERYGYDLTGGLRRGAFQAIYEVRRQWPQPAL